MGWGQADGLGRGAGRGPTGLGTAVTASGEEQMDGVLRGGDVEDQRPASSES